MENTASNSFRLSDIRVKGSGFHLVTDHIQNGNGTSRTETDAAKPTQIQPKPDGKRKTNLDPYSQKKLIKLDSKLRETSSATAAAPPEVKTNILFDPISNTRISYRILNPEDLNLYAPDEIKVGTQYKKHSRKFLKPKITEITENRSIQTVAVTRSGRQVRPPRSKTGTRDAAENGILGAEREAEKIINETESQKDRKRFCARIVCPACRKTYRGLKRMGRHLSINPTHAVTDKCKQLLEKYKLKLSGNVKVDVQTQTDSVEETDDGSLFRSLSRVLRETPAESRASVFVGQLAELTSRLQRLLPTLMCDSKSASSCVIDGRVGKILDLAPGKYHLNVEALTSPTEWTQPVEPRREWTPAPQPAHFDFDVRRFDIPLEAAKMGFGGTRDPVLGSESFPIASRSSASPDLLGPLEADCLSFSDSRSSQIGLDLQLDLFPFHHSQCE